jgi:hypothetical protein
VGKAQTIYQSEMALFSECRQSCAQIILDTADIVRDRDVTTAIDLFQFSLFNRGHFIPISNGLRVKAGRLSRDSKQLRTSRRGKQIAMLWCFRLH